MLYSYISRLYLKEIKYFGQFIHANTCTQMHYLKLIREIRQAYRRSHVILDANNCIVVL